MVISDLIHFIGEYLLIHVWFSVINVRLDIKIYLFKRNSIIIFGFKYIFRIF